MRLPETYFRNWSSASLYGGARTKTWSKIEVWDSSPTRLCRTIKVHADVVAKWGQDFQEDGTDTISYSCEFTAPAANQDIVIRFVSGGYVSGAFGALTWAQVTARPQDVILYVTR